MLHEQFDKPDFVRELAVIDSAILATIQVDEVVCMTD